MKIALDPFMHRHLSLETLPSKVAELGYEWIELSPRGDFLEWFKAPRVPENAPTPIHGGFALTHFSGDVKLEERIKSDLGVSVRCIPLEKSEPGTCPFTGQPSRLIIAVSRR